MKRGKRFALIAFFAPFFIVGLYLLAALVGALIPAQNSSAFDSVGNTEKTVEIYLLSTLLHVDIAIPITPKVRQKFTFLQHDNFPLFHPKLGYLVIGWGAREFYTSTKNLSDIGLGPVFSAVTGDSSVLHIIPSGDLSKEKGLRKLTISQSGLNQMIDNILGSLKLSDSQIPMVLSGKNHGLNDLFYKAKGRFNILSPCNIWTARMLRSSGVNTGIWTPTTFSLMMSLDR